MPRNDKAISIGVMVIFGIVFSLPVSAISQPFETSTVARIVGDSPEAMIAQLDGGSLNLEHATLYSNDWIYPEKYGGRAYDINKTLNSQFPGQNKVNFIPYNAIPGIDGWDWDDVQSGISSAGKKDLVIIESKGSIENNQLISESPKWLDEDLTPGNLDWNTDKKPLILFDSEYAGMHLPSFKSFVGKLAKDAVTIAPTAFPDKEFVKAFVCNLKDKDLGSIYRNARNNYYWSSKTPSGLALMSYELYGDPTLNVSIPKPLGDINQYCEGFLTDYSEMIKAGSLYADIGFSLKNYSIIKQDNFSILSVNNTGLSYTFGELILPYLTKKTEFPLRTLILNYTYLLSDPVTLTIADLPSWKGELANRTCWESNKPADIGFSVSFTEDKEAVIATVNPIEIVNCTKGELKLWRQVNYSIKYEPYSPIIIDSLEHLSKVRPNEKTGLTARIRKIVLNSSVYGTFVLATSNRTVAEKEAVISLSSEEFNISFYSNPEEGKEEYSLIFVRGNDTMTSATFSIETLLVESELIIPETAGTETTVQLKMENNGNESINSTIMDYLAREGAILAQGKIERALLPGENIINLTYSGLAK
ncbi:hypothetical protein HYU13_03200 [Candidatus Woesearchaeota archaeon]|nr:hypothetical protein [Candidatus Woesearchaeota archaeon]